MDLKGERVLSADRMTVWNALNDVDILQASVPGCREMTGDATDGFDAVVTQKIGPVKATFKGRVTLSDVVEGQSYRISGEGKGGPAGFAKGGALVTLETTETGGTLLRYDVTAKVGGKLASLGARLIDGVAKKLADQFFENFQVAVEGDNSPATEDEPDEIEDGKKGILGKIFAGKKE